ncbi:hypothetical protein T4A_13281 [Trichinella pseudospiralis]|uniref:Uncharacterized protein n=1 Tax=Trichinella pseudospiralis TaxID=6337 RepID=A0A0V1EK05_TRIPS|nr:hypothetical protein T4A_13281 [Trichinella pseudospiralis]
MALCIRSGKRISRGSKLIAYARKLNVQQVAFVLKLPKFPIYRNR